MRRPHRTLPIMAMVLKKYAVDPRVEKVMLLLEHDSWAGTPGYNPLTITRRTTRAPNAGIAVLVWRSLVLHYNPRNTSSLTEQYIVRNLSRPVCP